VATRVGPPTVEDCSSGPSDTVSTPTLDLNPLTSALIAFSSAASVSSVGLWSSDFLMVVSHSKYHCRRGGSCQVPASDDKVQTVHLRSPLSASVTQLHPLKTVDLARRAQHAARVPPCPGLTMSQGCAAAFHVAPAALHRMKRFPKHLACHFVETVPVSLSRSDTYTLALPLPPVSVRNSFCADGRKRHSLTTLCGASIHIECRAGLCRGQRLHLEGTRRQILWQTTETGKRGDNHTKKCRIRSSRALLKRKIDEPQRGPSPRYATKAAILEPSHEGSDGEKCAIPSCLNSHEVAQATEVFSGLALVCKGVCRADGMRTDDP